MFPLPPQPETKSPSAQRLSTFETLRRNALENRRAIHHLRHEGQGQALNSAHGTCWGGFNAVTEFVDHHCPTSGNPMVSAMFGRGAGIKRRAFEMFLKTVK
ncbi:MAG: hypothetical protein DRQ48_11550 [Gammaproteobacteria bacterium]|nr:MAG: hypothetical protein DRQ48_11550 [Gammaproteobacteria bacterium]